MKKPLFINIVFVGLIIFLSSSWAQDDQISLSSSVDRSRITIGDLITYTVTVTHHEDVKVEMPGLGANLGGFEIRDYNVHEPKKKDDNIISKVDYIISTFFTGAFEIPPLAVKYYTPEDSTAKILTTEKIKIVVESVKASEAGDIRDIKPPVEIPKNLWLLVRWFVLGSILLCFILLGFILYRRKKQGKSLLPIREVPPQPPHELAYEALDWLRSSALQQKGEIKLLYTEVSEIIRRYIEGRYFVIAMEMTTTEVLKGLSESGISDETYELFSDFLDQCDLVKFAKYIPSDQENEEILSLGYEIVDKTKVIIEEPKEEIETVQIEEGVKEEETVLLAETGEDVIDSETREVVS